MPKCCASTAVVRCILPPMRRRYPPWPTCSTPRSSCCQSRHEERWCSAWSYQASPWHGQHVPSSVRTEVVPAIGLLQTCSTGDGPAFCKVDGQQHHLSGLSAGAEAIPIPTALLPTTNAWCPCVCVLTGMAAENKPMRQIIASIRGLLYPSKLREVSLREGAWAGHARGWACERNGCATSCSCAQPGLMMKGCCLGIKRGAMQHEHDKVAW